MRVIGQTGSGTLIIETTQAEWTAYVTQTFVPPFDLGGAIKTHRKKTGQSQAALARLVGVSRNYISLLERGEASNPSAAVYGRLVRVLGQFGEDSPKGVDIT